MAMLLAALHPRRQDASDRGMTLVELLVSMMLLTIVIGLATGLLINGMNRQSNIGQSTDAMNTNQNGMELMTRLLRQAVYPNTSTNSAALPIISSATPTQIVFTSRLASTADPDAAAVSKFTIWLDGTDLKWNSAALVMNSCTASSCTYGAPTPWKFLVRGVRNLSGTTACPDNTGFSAGPFQYVSLDPTGAPTPLAFPIAQPSLKLITYVRIALYTQTQTGPQKPGCRPLTDYVQLRNL